MTSSELVEKSNLLDSDDNITEKWVQTFSSSEIEQFLKIRGNQKGLFLTYFDSTMQYMSHPGFVFVLPSTMAKIMSFEKNTTFDDLCRLVEESDEKSLLFVICSVKDEVSISITRILLNNPEDPTSK